MTRWTMQIVIVLLISCLYGCLSTKSVVPPRDARTMQEIYETHHEQTDSDLDSRTTLEDHLDRSSTSRDVEKELDSGFPLLHNPMLIMYVFPHVATPSRIPIPGYWTAFPLYEGQEFALPGEQRSPTGSSD